MRVTEKKADGTPPSRPPLITDRALLIVLAAGLIGLAATRSWAWTVGLSVSIAAAGLLRRFLDE